MKERLKELNILGAIKINQTKMNNIKFMVDYEKIEPKEHNESLVEMTDYKKACTEILDCV